MIDFNYNMNKKRVDKEKKQKERLFRNADEISEGRKNNTINLVERKMRIFYVTNILWKTSQTKRKIN